jgi:uncharacterized iron-regulated membrane protein
MTFRKTIFWLHLAAGLTAGLVIAIMSFTGAALAFEKDIIAWVERDARQVSSPAEAKRLPLQQLIKRARDAQPDSRPVSLIISRDPTTAVTFTTGRSEGYYANPYTAEIRQGSSARTREFMRVMNAWHRTIALSGDHRAVGKAITGACNIAFLLLGLSGLYLWWPRSWSWRNLRAIALFDPKLRGKPRDWNWHNVFGFWCAPVIIVLTATALPLSYRWAGDLIYKLTGTAAPVAGAGAGPAFSPSSPAEVPLPPSGAKPLGYDTLLASVEQQFPDWELITLRLGVGGGRSQETRRAETNGDSARDTSSQTQRPVSASAADARDRGETRSGPQAVTFTIRESSTWPRTATTTLALDPFTGSVLRRENFSDQNLGRQVRTWTRFLHTGEALGWGGQLIAGLASLGACVLVYSGFALSWRRFFGKRIQPASSASSSV